MSGCQGGGCALCPGGICVGNRSTPLDALQETYAMSYSVGTGGDEQGRATGARAFLPRTLRIRRSGPSLLVLSCSVGATTDRTFVIRNSAGKTEWVDVMTGLTSGPLVEAFGISEPAMESPDREPMRCDLEQKLVARSEAGA